jgi:hypothetical protein
MPRPPKRHCIARKREPTVHLSTNDHEPSSSQVKHKLVMRGKLSAGEPQVTQGKKLKVKKTKKNECMRRPQGIHNLAKFRPNTRKQESRANELLVGIQGTLHRARQLHH